MKKLLTLLLALPLAWGHAAAQENAKYTILLTGASFASPQNGWFEIGCRQLDARALNRAIGGAYYTTAILVWQVKFIIIFLIVYLCIL